MRKPKVIFGETNNSLDSGEDAEISSYERIAKILISLSTGTSSVTEIARECDMKVPTVHRLLKSLTKPRFTVYDAVNHRYFLGPLIAQLSSNASTNHQYLRMCSLKEMKRLSEIFGESVTLTVMIGAEFIQIFDIEGKHELMVQGLGENSRGSLPMFPIGATQRVLLSQLDDTNLRQMLNNAKNQEQTTVDLDAAFFEISQIRIHGYAISSGEIIAGATCLACPVANYFFPSALSVIGPKSRLSKKTPGLLKTLKESADRISETLVYENIFKK